MIPSQLQRPGFRFVLIPRVAKAPCEKQWTTRNHYRFDDPKLTEWLAQGQVLNHQLQPGPEQDPGKSNCQCPSQANHGTSIAGGWPMGKANAAPEVTEGPRSQPPRNNVEGQGLQVSLRTLPMVLTADAHAW